MPYPSCKRLPASANCPDTLLPSVLSSGIIGFKRSAASPVLVAPSVRPSSVALTGLAATNYGNCSSGRELRHRSAADRQQTRQGITARVLCKRLPEIMPLRASTVGRVGLEQQRSTNTVDHRPVVGVFQIDIPGIDLNPEHATLVLVPGKIIELAAQLHGRPISHATLQAGA